MEYPRKYKKASIFILGGITIFSGLAACTFALGTAYGVSKGWLETSLIGLGLTAFFLVAFLLFVQWTKDVIADKPLRWTWETKVSPVHD